MLKESLKYFFLTLFAAFCILAGVICLKQYWIRSSQVTETALDSISAAAVAVTPDAVLSVLPGPLDEMSELAASMEPAETPTPTSTPETFENKLKRYISSLSVEEKIGQMMMFGFSGTTMPDAKYLQIFRDYQIGNFLLLGPNIDRQDSSGGFDTCRKLTGFLQEEEVLPALIAIDVEGGKVVRFRWEDWPESAALLGETGNPDFAEEQFLRIAVQLRDCGINVDLAPVLDVSSNPEKTALRTRIISSDPNTVSTIGTAIVRGIQEGGCLSAAKHFPGHGGTSQDSHETLPVIRKTLESLYEYDLIPFRSAIDAGVDLILVAHILYPELDEEYPASLSPTVLTTLLREELGFDGIIISDDFRMSGLTEGRTIGEAAIQFLTAGGDMILCGPNANYQKQIVTAVREAAEKGTLSEERMDESLFRILQRKLLVTNWELSN